jgi:hypothetical protein
MRACTNYYHKPFGSIRIAITARHQKKQPLQSQDEECCGYTSYGVNKKVTLKNREVESFSLANSTKRIKDLKTPT